MTNLSAPALPAVEVSAASAFPVSTAVAAAGASVHTVSRKKREAVMRHIPKVRKACACRLRHRMRTKSR